MWRDTEHVTVKIYRFTQIPTPEMIANNESSWSEGNWNRSIGGANDFYVVDNGLPVRGF